MKTAQQAAANWIGSAGRAQTEWSAGVQAYSGDWAGATTRQQSVLLQNVTQAISNGTWAAGVNRVGTVKNDHYVGDSAIVDPAGLVLVEASMGETVLVADVTAERVANVRKRFPFLADRRT